jgi:hypothetical protein
MTTKVKMSMREKIGARRVKATKKASATRTKSKPLTREDIEQIVEETVHSNSPLVRVYDGTAAVLGGIGEGIYTITEKAFSALKAIASGVWTFLGRIYASAADAVRAVVNWLGQMATAAVGKVREALSYVKELISSMNVDWVAVNNVAINLMVAAATIGISVVAGVLSGGAMAGVAASLGGSTLVQQITAVFFGAVTAGCVAEVAYAFFQAGVRRELLATCLTEAEALVEAETQQSKPVTVVNAVAVS